MTPAPCLCPRCPKHVVDRFAAFCDECVTAGCTETHTACRRRSRAYQRSARREYQGERARASATGRAKL